MTSTMVSPHRWIAKKAARSLVTFGSAATGTLWLRDTLASEHSVRVLTYHGFGSSRRDPFCVDAARFENQMAYLAKNDLAISLSQLQDHLARGSAFDRRRVLVTIDDGLKSVIDVAAPILRNYRIPAVLYVSPGMMQTSSKRDTRHYLNWSELDTLVAQGLSVGSHSWSHRSFGELNEIEMIDEASRSRSTLEQNLKVPIRSFAYPFGTRADFNDLSSRVLEECGYEVALTSQHGPVTSNADPLRLPRLKIEGGESLAMFKLIVRGGLDAWRVVDRLLWRLQSSAVLGSGAATSI